MSIQGYKVVKKKKNKNSKTIFGCGILFILITAKISVFLYLPTSKQIKKKKKKTNNPNTYVFA